MRRLALIPILVALAAGGAQAQINDPPKSANGPWVRNTKVSDNMCGLIRKTPEFELRVFLPKDDSPLALSLSSPRWNFPKMTRYQARLIAGDHSGDAFVWALSESSLFFELQDDKRFHESIAISGSLTLRSSIPLDLQKVGVYDLTIPLDYGAEALKLLAECGLPKTHKVPFNALGSGQPNRPKR